MMRSTLTAELYNEYPCGETITQVRTYPVLTCLSIRRLKMNKDFHETKTKIPKTPDIIKELFKPFLFPCNNKKIPAIPKGSSWERHNRYKKPVFRGTEYPLCGVDCGEAKIVVVDGDTYKPDFKQSKESQTFYNECRKKIQVFLQNTKWRGTYLF